MHLVAVLSLLSVMVSPVAAQWTKHVITTQLNTTASLAATDIDRDGCLDLVGAAILGNKVVWWRNGGTAPLEWVEDTIDAGLAGACFAFPADVDRDGDVDIVAAAWFANQVVWYRNDGGEPVAWVRQVIDGAFGQAHEACAADLDRDGDIDIVAAGAAAGEIAWWRNEGGTPPVWTRRPIAGGFDGTRSAAVMDLDGDGHADVVGAALGLGRVSLWYGDDGTTWTEQLVDGGFGGAHFVRPGDLDGDQDTDLVGAGYTSSFAWWRNDGGTPRHWTRQNIDALAGPLTVAPADLDNDGDVDVLGAATDGNAVVWCRNDGGDPIVWTREVIDDALAGAWPVLAADLDGDGDLDIAAGGTNSVVWYESSFNAGPPDTFSLVAPLPGAAADSTPVLVWHRAADPDGKVVRYQLFYASRADFRDATEVRDLTDTTWTPSAPLAQGTYYWKVRAADSFGAARWSREIDWWFRVEPTGGAPEADPSLPAGSHSLALSANPVARSVGISYWLAAATRVDLRVCSPSGQVVRVVEHRAARPGQHHAAWDGRDSRGRTLPSGIYFIELTTDAGCQSAKVVLVE